MARYQHTGDERRVRASIGRMPGGASQALTDAVKRIGFDENDMPCPIDLGTVRRVLGIAPQ